MVNTTPNVFVEAPPDLQDEMFDAETIDRLESIANVTWNTGEDNLSQSELAAALEGIDAVVTGWGSPQFDETVLESADSLELLAHTGGSVASYVTPELYDREITVCSANRPMARYVAELTLGHCLSAQRNICAANNQIKAGGYPGDEHGSTMIDAEIGVIGLGTIGRYLLPMLAPFAVSVEVYDPYVPPVDVAEYDYVTKGKLDAVLDSDIVTIHAARTPATIGMLGPDELATIPDDSLLVNTARAEIIQRDALYDELTSGRIQAALDVYHDEPLPADDPLRELDNVQLTPHLGGHGPHHRFGAAVTDEIDRYFSDRALQHEIPREQADLMTR